MIPAHTNININVSWSSAAISVAEVVRAVNKSVTAYFRAVQLSAFALQYDVVGNNQVAFCVSVSDHAYTVIMPSDLKQQIQADLDRRYGDGEVVVDATSNEKGHTQAPAMQTASDEWMEYAGIITACVVCICCAIVAVAMLIRKRWNQRHRDVDCRCVELQDAEPGALQANDVYFQYAEDITQEEGMPNTAPTSAKPQYTGMKAVNVEAFVRAESTVTASSTDNGEKNV